MSLDKKLLAGAKLALDKRRREKQAEHERRISEVYRLNPRVRELDAELRSTAADAIGYALMRGGDPEEALYELRDENLHLQSERAHEIMAAGFSPQYLDEEYFCPKCRDTGYVGTEPCSCLMKLYAEEQRVSLSSLLKLGRETFDTFELKWYDDLPDPVTGVSPRQNMENIYEACVLYARKFGERAPNLFFSGPTGLGKTFLSACIARVVSEKGFSVVYDTATAIFTRFEEARFERGADPEAARAEVRRYMESDLFIIDDLGTELTNAFSVSVLYEIINTRLMSNKKTIINSNLSLKDMTRRYSPQIVSRIDGEYQLLRFFGRDIRVLKKEML